jgi:hypothetical protein
LQIRTAKRTELYLVTLIRGAWSARAAC